MTAQNLIDQENVEVGGSLPYISPTGKKVTGQIL
jgi:hypothetical protein